MSYSIFSIKAAELCPVETHLLKNHSYLNSFSFFVFYRNKRKPLQFILLIICFVLRITSLSAQLAQCNNLLTNSSFESPVQSNLGDNLTGSFTFNGWTMTGSPFNVVRVNGSAYYGGPDKAADVGSQYVDIVSAAGTVYQNFTISGGSSMPVFFGGFFSSREGSVNYINWTGSVQIYAMPANTLVSTSSTRAFTVADGTASPDQIWYYLFGTATLSPGNYRFVANFGDYGNFDMAYVSQECALPVNLISCTGQYLNNAVKLSWKMADQSSLSGFEIERSIDGRVFNSIAQISLSTNNQYNYSDQNLTRGAVFYRLKMNGIDGSISYSSIIKMKIENMHELLVTPNPVMSTLNISGIGDRGWIRIADQYGKIVIEKSVQSQTLSVNVSSLPAGIYLVEYFDETEVQTRKIIKR